MTRALYDLFAGPLALGAFVVCLVGLAVRVVVFVALLRREAAVVPENFRWGWAAPSVLRYLLPVNTTNRANPLATMAGFVFHAALIGGALFLSAHVVLMEQAWGLTWPALPDLWSDALAAVALAGLMVLAGRRLLDPKLRGLTEARDLWLLLLVALPPATGLAAHLLLPGYEYWMLLHVVSADVLLAAIPFTKLSHALLFVLSRAVTGSDFGKRRVGPW